MREKEAHRDKDDVGDPSHWGDPVSLEFCRRIDGYLSRLDIGCVLSFDRAERAVILSGGEIEGWGVRLGVNQWRWGVEWLVRKHTQTHCHTDWRSCGPLSRTFTPDKLFKYPHCDLNGMFSYACHKNKIWSFKAWSSSTTLKIFPQRSMSPRNKHKHIGYWYGFILFQQIPGLFFKILFLGLYSV